MAYIINLSVHDIVDTLLRRGHIDTRIFNQTSMQEGTRLHALYQAAQQDGYIDEYPLSHTFIQEDFIFRVSGKADGVYISPENKKEVLVEEIKTTVAPLDEFIADHGEWHLGQAMFYAYILALDKKLDHVEILLTYIRQQNTQEMKKIRKTYLFEDLKRFVEDLILRYTRFQKKLQRFKMERNQSTIDLAFPFSEFRPGQKEMMDFVTKANENEEKVYIEAPTGSGKTISVLYPLIKRFGEKKLDCIYYLTSKNSIKKIAMDTIQLFQNLGVKCKSIEYTAKENVCFNDKKGHCNPDECPFAHHYYDKLMDAILDSLELEDAFTRSRIEDICYHHTMCPYQFQLDLSQYCDILVMDYSYVFDYRDRMALEQGSVARTKTSLLIDECHNLPERVRDMYSLEFFLSDIKDVLPSLGRMEFSTLKADVLALEKAIEEIELDNLTQEDRKEHVYVMEKIPDNIVSCLEDFLVDMKASLKKFALIIDENMLNFFYLANSFSILANYCNAKEYEGEYLIYCRLNAKNEITSIKISNLDSRKIIEECTDYFSSTTFFSATLSPKEYYIDLLAGEIKEDNHLFLHSPFSMENRRVFLDTRLSLRYQDRNETLYSVYSLCRNAIEQKMGNYFIFCPSFDYLEQLASFFMQDHFENTSLVIQSRSMKEQERAEFLSKFESNPDKTTIGLLVLGGVFSEGIDLVGNRLIGAIIISAGLPSIGFERNHLKNYFSKDENGQKGFHYAYTYPGINKILQAGGRVIRTKEDKGFILYIDSRFSQSLYQKIFKEVYPDFIRVVSPSQVKAALRQFWKEKDNNEL